MTDKEIEKRYMSSPCNMEGYFQHKKSLLLLLELVKTIIGILDIKDIDKIENEIIERVNVKLEEMKKQGLEDYKETNKSTLELEDMFRGLFGTSSKN